MQKLYTLLLFLLLSFSARAQLRIMFIDDSGDSFGNSEYLASTLDSLGYEYIYIDAIGQNYSPTAAEMSDYDLVIWHTSSWGAGLQFWNGTDAVNTGLVEYLSQPNARLWLIGLDYFYDRYGSAPANFVAGDFEYDFLGISKYAVQSYADDGGLGVPLVTPAPGQPIPGLGNIDWQFSTLWYADGFQLRPEAMSVYLFGGNGYVLNGTPTAVLNHPPGAGTVLAYGFDLSLASSFGLMRNHVSTVLNWWENQVTPTKSPADESFSVKITPNTFSDQLDIRVKAQESGPLTVRVFDAGGQLVAMPADRLFSQAGQEKVIRWKVAPGLSRGVYYCSIQSGTKMQTKKLVKQ